MTVMALQGMIWGSLMRHLVNLSRVIYGADEATDGMTNQKFVSEACDADQVQAMGKLDPTKGTQDLTNH
jgi:hypothetical protein